MTHDSPILTRRTALAGFAAAIAAAAPGRQAAAAPLSTTKLPLTAATTEGPYYLDPRLLRSDVTEGLPGVPLEVRFTVLDENGRALDGMRVDLWHCDALGRYSGYGRQGDDGSVSMEGRTFLRGHQLTAVDGTAAFRSVYPGWYAGRTTHIHFKVIHGAKAVLTSQFFLPDALSEFLYVQLPDYKRAALRDTLNSSDGIALEAGHTVIGAIREEGDRYVATLTLVVDPASNPKVDRPPVPGGPPPGGPTGPDRPEPPPGRARGPMGPGFAGPPGGRPPGMGPRHPETLAGEARLRALVPAGKAS